MFLGTTERETLHDALQDPCEQARRATEARFLLPGLESDEEHEIEALVGSGIESRQAGTNLVVEA